MAGHRAPRRGPAARVRRTAAAASSCSRRRSTARSRSRSGSSTRPLVGQRARAPIPARRPTCSCRAARVLEIGDETHRARGRRLHHVRPAPPAPRHRGGRRDRGLRRRDQPAVVLSRGLALPDRGWDDRRRGAGCFGQCGSGLERAEGIVDRMRRTVAARGLALAALLATMGFAACGDDDDDGDSSATSAAAPASDTPPRPPATPRRPPATRRRRRPATPRPRERHGRRERPRPRRPAARTSS